MNLQFVHPSKNMPTEHQLLVKVVSYRKYGRRWFNYIPKLAEHKISEIYDFSDTQFLVPPSRGGKKSFPQLLTNMQKAALFKENKLAFRNVIIY